MRMKNYLLLFLLSALAFCVASDEVDCEAALTTLEINACISREVEQAEGVLERYLAAAMAQYEAEPQVQDSLRKSQEAWLAYRETHCDGVYTQWQGGTIRGAVYGHCMLKLTKARTHLLWEDYLTYMDSTPPLLPEPEL